MTHTFAKSNMLYLLTKIQEHRNKDVRENCLLALEICLKTRMAQIPERYLANIEEMFICALQDASPTCRAQARSCYWLYAAAWPERAEANIVRFLDLRTQTRLTDRNSASAASPEKRVLSARVSSLDLTDTAPSDASSFRVGERVCLVVRRLYGYIRYVGRSCVAMDGSSNY